MHKIAPHRARFCGIVPRLVSNGSQGFSFWSKIAQKCPKKRFRTFTNVKHRTKWLPLAPIFFKNHSKLSQAAFQNQHNLKNRSKWLPLAPNFAQNHSKLSQEAPQNQQNHWFYSSKTYDSENAQKSSQSGPKKRFITFRNRKNRAKSVQNIIVGAFRCGLALSGGPRWPT